MTFTPYSIFWMRRDLRLKDNTALFNALNMGLPVRILFIFDTEILSKLTDKTDARVSFIYQELQILQNKLEKWESSILVEYGSPSEIFSRLVGNTNLQHVFYNEDYEPFTRKRDQQIDVLLKEHKVQVHRYKDHVVFHKHEIVKSDGTPYTVFTPYFTKWKHNLGEQGIKIFSSESLLGNLYKTKGDAIITLSEVGFKPTEKKFPSGNFANRIADYEKYRDYPAKDATSKIGVFLRFGTVSIREAVSTALALRAEKWLSELAWRDFYSMILWNFPNTENESFKEKFRFIKWRNNEEDFEKWCSGNTGYPLVDAGMRQLNATGYMHNRVRMVTASFLCKHLLIDWKWGEIYFASKLLDYDLASNVGGWQWAASTGNDAVPYFRIFNPQTQLEKFDPKLEYIKKWIPEYGTKKYAQPMVEHTFARTRALNAFKKLE